MRRDVYYYFQQACRREVQPMPSRIQFETNDDARAAFVLGIGALERIESVEYRCTTCVTLVALCEHLAQELRGSTIQQARSFTAERLLTLHPEIPSVRSSRAQLALAAVRAALENISS
jgi:hypothetical protein